MAFPSSSSPAHDPGLFEITLGVLLSVTLGILLACVHLAAQPVTKVRELPKDVVEGAIYYVEGSSNSQSGRQWMRKRQLLTEKQPGEIALIEDELNTWARAAYAPASASSGEKESSGPMLVTNTPNFRIAENRLQIGFECDFQVYGFKRQVIVQLRGEVVRDGNVFAFEPDEVQVGGLPAGRLPVLGSFVANRLLSAQQLPDDLTEAWAALDYAKVEGRQLVLRLP